MMGRISDGSDLIKSNVVSYLDWSHPHLSIALLHFCTLSSIIILFIVPFLPWRLLLLIAGESVLVAQHPLVQTFSTHLAKHLPTRRLLARLERIIANDALPDHVLDAPAITTVACREHQRYGGAGSGWSDTYLEDSDPSAWTQEQPHHVLQPAAGLWYVFCLFFLPSSRWEGYPSTHRFCWGGARAVQPPTGFKWIPSERWYIDHTTSSDDEGWCFINTAAFGPSLRRRRWLRRAFQPLERRSFQSHLPYAHRNKLLSHKLSLSYLLNL